MEAVAASFVSDGGFRGSTVAVRNPELDLASAGGNEGGLSPNRLDAAGDPRPVAGTPGGQAASSGGPDAVFAGAYDGATLKTRRGVAGTGRAAPDSPVWRRGRASRLPPLQSGAHRDSGRDSRHAAEKISVF